MRTIFGGALRDDAAAAGAALGTQIDDPVRFRHDVEVVLDDDHRIAGVDQAMQHLQEFLDIGHVQADRRLVEHVERVLALAARDVQAERIGADFREFGHQLDALALAARQRRARLAETQVTQAHVAEQARRDDARCAARQRTPARPRRSSPASRRCSCP